MAKKKQVSQYDLAIEGLAAIPNLDERGRIELLIRTQDQLNNGDAMCYFGNWLDAVCEVLDIDIDDIDPLDNPFG